MKLRLSIIAIAALALLFGCGKDRPSPADEQRRPILFSASSGVKTKTYDPSDITRPNDPRTLIDVGNAVSVFGVWRATIGDDSIYETLFYNRRLRCNNVYLDDPLDPLSFDPEDQNSSVWDYDPLEYWKNTGDYCFTAVSPYTTNDASINSAYELKIAYRAGSNQDLMVARAYRAEPAGGKDRVELNFKHVTSAVRFLFGTASDAGDKFKLTSFRLENLSPRGTLTIDSRLSSPIDFSPGGPDDPLNWSAGAIGVLGTLFEWSADASDPEKTITYPADPDSPDGYAQMGWYYMVPHTLNAGASVVFSVSYDGQTPVETTLNISDCELPAGADVWQPNHVYNYFITVSQSGADIEVKATPWDEVSITTDPITFEG
jgi:hypothetical protein